MGWNQLSDRFPWGAGSQVHPSLGKPTALPAWYCITINTSVSNQKLGFSYVGNSKGSIEVVENVADFDAALSFNGGICGMSSQGHEAATRLL